MDTITAILLGVVEGITEFLPVSSTGHLILVSDLLGLEHTEFLKSFEIAIQLGAILAVVLLYFRKLFFERGVLARVVTAFAPTAILGGILYPVIKTYLIGNSGVVLIALFLGGVFLIFFERWYKKKNPLSTNGEEGQEGAKLDFPSLQRITFRQAFIIGLCQSVSMIPGVSRAAATIIGGLALGLSREVIVEFSFLLAIPTMAAATGFDLLRSVESFSGNDWSLLAAGFLAAFASALLAVRFLVSFIKRHTFISFGFYRIFAALIFFLILF